MGSERTNARLDGAAFIFISFSFSGECGEYGLKRAEVSAVLFQQY